MSLKKMILLAGEIDRLRDEIQRLTIENDLLRQKIKAVAIQANVPPPHFGSKIKELKTGTA